MTIDYGQNDLNDLVDTLKDKLLDYLLLREVIPADYDIDSGAKFKCLNPAHEDKDPSMSFVKSSGGRRIRCFSCGSSADIFQAAVWIDGAPESGADWVKENVYFLADEFNISYVEHIPTPEEMKKARVLELLKDAADCLSGMTRVDPDKGFVHTRARGLSDDVCIEMIVGTVDFNEFMDTLSKYSNNKWSREFCENNNVGPAWFGQEFITITLMDANGNVIGFDRRFVFFSKEMQRDHRKLGESYPRKFFLPRKSDVFDPSIFVYGLHRAKLESWRGGDIVEGYFDVISGIQSGHKTIMSACGTMGIKDTHLDHMKNLDFIDLCFVYDCDEAGKKAVSATLKKFKNREDIRISFKYLKCPGDLEIEGLDPDLFFRKFCKEDLTAYSNIPSKSSFRVSLDFELERGTAGEDLARSQIPRIACESDALLRGNMIRELSEKTGCEEADIRASVDSILSGKAKNIARDLINEIKRGDFTPSEISVAVNKAQSKLSPLFGGKKDLVNQRAAKVSFHSAMDLFYSKKGVIPGWRTGIPMIDNRLGGIQDEMFLVVYGNPNSGKSAFVHFIVGGLLKNLDVNKDMCIIFLSFDDSAPWSWAKQLAVYTGFDITHCAEPQKYILNDPDKTRVYKEAHEFFRSSVDMHFWLFGGDVGMNAEQVTAALNNAQQATGKKILIVVDSFNKMHGIDGLEGVAKYEKNAEYLHELVHNGHTVITTAETVKAAQGRKPNMGDLSDTKRITFNANVVLGVYNPLHELRDNSEYFWVAKGDDGKYRKAAVLQTDIPKNRVTSYKGTDVFKFYDSKSRFEEIDDIKSFMSREFELWNKYGHDNVLSGSRGGGGGFSVKPSVNSSIFDTIDLNL